MDMHLGPFENLTPTQPRGQRRLSQDLRHRRRALEGILSTQLGGPAQVGGREARKAEHLLERRETKRIQKDANGRRQKATLEAHVKRP